jgi:TP901 family phage tail tape measure protein
MTQFRLQGKDVPHIADLLAAGADKALGSVHDLSEALKYGGLAAAQAGFSIDETVGVLAELAQSGQIGSMAGAQLAMMLRNLQKPTDQAAGLMKQLGITVYDQSGQMRSAADIAGQLHDKIGGLPPAQRDAALATLFTSRAVRAANILMREGVDATQGWIDKVNDAGFAAHQASGKLDSLSGDATKLRAALQTALIGTGEDAQGPLRAMVQDVTTSSTPGTRCRARCGRARRRSRSVVR